MISNISYQTLDSTAVETNKSSTAAQSASTNQNSIGDSVDKNEAASPSTIVKLSGATAPENPLTSAAGTSGNIGKPPPTQSQETLDYTTQSTSGGIGKPPPTEPENTTENVEGTSGGIGKPPP